jgi:hypothetical protein
VCQPRTGTDQRRRHAWRPHLLHRHCCLKFAAAKRCSWERFVTFYADAVTRTDCPSPASIEADCEERSDRVGACREDPSGSAGAELEPSATIHATRIARHVPRQMGRSSPRSPALILQRNSAPACWLIPQPGATAASADAAGTDDPPGRLARGARRRQSRTAATHPMLTGRASGAPTFPPVP